MQTRNFQAFITEEEENYIKSRSNQGLVFNSQYSQESEDNYDQFSENYSKTVKLMKEMDQSVKKSEKAVSDSLTFINRASSFIEEVELKARLNAIKNKSD